MTVKEEPRVVIQGQVWPVPQELGLEVLLHHHLLVRHTAALWLVGCFVFEGKSSDKNIATMGRKIHLYLHTHLQPLLVFLLYPLP